MATRHATLSRRTGWGVSSAIAAALLATTLTSPSYAGPPDASFDGRGGDNAVLIWNRQIATALNVNNQGSPHPTPPPVGARTFAVVHTAIFDTWAAYDHRAVGTQRGGELRRPRAERTEANKRKAVSFAAHRALSDLFPLQHASFDEQLRAQGYDPTEAKSRAPKPGSPASVAATATDALLTVRHEDGSRQQAEPAYATPEGYYEPVNPPQDVNTFDKAALVAPDRWAPLTVGGSTHTFITPQFATVKPFAIEDPAAYIPPAPPKYGTPEANAAIDAQIQRNANLTERQKAIAEHWQYRGSSSSSIPQEWAAFVSKRDRHSLDEDVKMYFALNLAQGDEGVVDWKTKVDYDYARPITMIRYAKAGEQIRGYAGPGKGTQTIDGSQWRPYLNTPAFAAYGSGHSGFTAAGAETLKQFTGSDRYGATGTIKAGSSKIETAAPAQDVGLKWNTFSEAAQEVGESRLWGGVHWEFDHTVADEQGRELARDVWAKTQHYINGTHQETAGG
ncbi:vanadium-dependent haloperoxidase [Streptomyces sp. NPDC058701]|uniref:vanadium-dependent haloperoxidase n=1 Tax=Streptomyces sp. NPDC058701 TaxID=3346608 RepID=UPI00365FB7D0